MPDNLKQRIAAMKEAAEKAQKKCPGPWFVDSDDAEECGPHAHSGLFMVNSGRGGDDWDIARLCEATEASHIAACDPESVLALIAELEQLQTALADANGLCRSALSIAEREGIQTNWAAFTDQLKESLTRQHKAMYSSHVPSPECV